MPTPHFPLTLWNTILLSTTVLILSYILNANPGQLTNLTTLLRSNPPPNMTTIPPFPTSPSTSTNNPHPTPYPQLHLFGDSITQASTLGLHAPLSALYLRRLDVLNRGFSGYNTRHALPLLPLLFPPIPPAPTKPDRPRIIGLTIFFGANDAVHPQGAQHVPLDEYASNLHQIINWPGTRLHGTKVLLLTAPPVDEWQLPDGSRTAERTKRYADAARAVGGREEAVVVVDVWRVFMRRAGWVEDGDSDGAGKEEEGRREGGFLPGDKRRERNEVLGRLLSDGLHFTEEGYRVLYEELVRVIQTEARELDPQEVPIVHPDWKVVMGVEA